MADLSNFRPGLSCFYKTDSGGGTAVQEYHITATGLGITRTYRVSQIILFAYMITIALRININIEIFCVEQLSGGCSLPKK